MKRFQGHCTYLLEERKWIREKKKKTERGRQSASCLQQLWSKAQSESPAHIYVFIPYSGHRQAKKKKEEITRRLVAERTSYRSWYEQSQKKKKTVCFLRFYWYVIKSGRCPLLTKVNLCVCVRACVRACATQRKENENTVTRARMCYSKQCRTISEIKKKR